mmetsp:Transcript_27627/g.81801  ORF Transcript_27627/g.81801 Transcript_27627/m.81801 type:complete len:282 (-) Transcript_27627:1033-1878(-)
MHERERRDHLANDEAHRRARHAARRAFQQLQQIGREVLHDDLQPPVGQPQLVNEAHHVGMLQRTQHRELTRRVAEHVVHLLDCAALRLVRLDRHVLRLAAALAGPSHSALHHAAIAAFPDHAFHDVLPGENAHAADHDVVCVRRLQRCVAHCRSRRSGRCSCGRLSGRNRGQERRRRRPCVLGGCCAICSTRLGSIGSSATATGAVMVAHRRRPVCVIGVIIRVAIVVRGARGTRAVGLLDRASRSHGSRGRCRGRRRCARGDWGRRRGRWRCACRGGRTA